MVFRTEVGENEKSLIEFVRSFWAAAPKVVEHRITTLAEKTSIEKSVSKRVTEDNK